MQLDVPLFLDTALYKIQLCRDSTQRRCSPAQQPVYPREIEEYSTLGVGMGLEYEKRITRNTRFALGLDLKYNKAFSGQSNFYVGPKLTVKF